MEQSIPNVILGDRDVVTVEGPGAFDYLQSQVSQDLRGQRVGEERWTLLLDPTGKIVVVARVRRTDDERFELDTDAGYGSAMLARLDRFKIRVAATTSLQTADESHEVNIDADTEGERARIEWGWPRMGREIVAGETLVAGTGLARLAVSFTKGCYPGQELVERMDSRSATAPRNLRRLTVAAGTQAGDPVFDSGEEVGVVTSVAGELALAWIKRTSDVGDTVEVGAPATGDA